MDQSTPELRRDAVLQAMRKGGHGAITALMDALDDPDPIVREWAVDALSRRPGREAVAEALLGRLRDDRADVRWYAARSLGKVKVATEKVAQALTAALGDQDEYVRSYAAWALGRLQLESAAEALETRLRELTPTPKSREAQVVGVAVARLNTGPRAAEEDRQGTLFEPEDIPELPPADEWPKTRGERLDRDMAEMATTILQDRTGTTVAAKAIWRSSISYGRSAALKERVLGARGRRCQLCQFTFRKKNGLLYAECHHVIPVHEGGPDEADNLLVVCANHHRQLHFAHVEFPEGESRAPVVTIEGRPMNVTWPTGA